MSSDVTVRYASDRTRRLAGAALWLRGSVAMAADAYAGTVDLVADVHRAISQTGATINPVAVPERVTRDLIYAGVRGIGAASFYGARSAASLTTFGEAQTGERYGDAQPAHILRSALNGAIGDYLEASGNELAQAMQFVDAAGRVVDPIGARPIAVEAASPRLVVLVHGLGMHEGHWRQAGAADFGDRLAADYGYTVLRLRYNSGRRIGDNGRELAEQLEALIARYPVPLSRVTLIGHSMGGLIARRAVRHGGSAGHAWIASLADVICLGSPHRGAPLERWGHRFNQALTIAPYTRPFSAIGERRSAGVKDLRYGNRRNEPQDDALGYFLVAATLGRRGDNPLNRGLGDLLVPVNSAFGHAAGTATAVDGRLLHGMSHFALVHRDDVYAAIVGWLGPRLAKADEAMLLEAASRDNIGADDR